MKLKEILSQVPDAPEEQKKIWKRPQDNFVENFKDEIELTFKKTIILLKKLIDNINI